MIPDAVLAKSLLYKEPDGGKKLSRI